MHGNELEAVAFTEQQVTELGLTDARCVRQHRLEDRLQLTR